MTEPSLPRKSPRSHTSEIFAKSVERLGGQPPRASINVSNAKAGEWLEEVIWIGPLWDWSGYSEEARGFVTGLRRAGYPLRARSFTKELEGMSIALERDDPESAKLLIESVDQGDQPSPVAVVHAPPDVHIAYEDAWNLEYVVARTMFETDGLPQSWVVTLNSVDEVWVPSHFNQETFERSGVKVPIHVVPGGVDTNRFRPGCPALPIPGLRGTVYLSVFQWSFHKGYDVLLEAWAEAFKPDDDVCLLLHCYPRNWRSSVDAARQIEAAIAAELKRMDLERSSVAPIILVNQSLSPRELVALMATADIYVAPSRGEGYGRPQMEAMAAGLPVIATRWSGNLEYMNDHNSLLLETEGLVQVEERMDLEQFYGQRWAKPSKDHLVELLRSTAKRPKWLNSISKQARRDIETNFTWEAVSNLAKSRLKDISKELHGRRTAMSTRAAMTDPSWTNPAPAITIEWVGDVYAHHSLARVNRELGKAIANLGVAIHHATEESPAASSASNAKNETPTRGDNRPERSHGQRREAETNRMDGDGDKNGMNQEILAPPEHLGQASIEIRHRFPPYFSPARNGRLVIIQPWEFIGMPEAWVRGLNTYSDEVWCPSSWVKEQYLRSGVDESKVHVVPNGVDTELFKPEGGSYPLSTKRSYKFLFVGGPIERKGIDVLVDAYVATFTPASDVCLVIKAFGTDTVYRRGSFVKMLYQASKDPTLPEIELIDQDIGDEELASLYRSCDVLVSPYRGEGFGLPIAEAMSSGLPVVVTGQGGAMDFCREDNAYLVPAFERPTSISDFPPSTLGGYRWYEPDRRELKATLQYVATHPEEARKIGTKARETITSEFTWKHAAETAYRRLTVLAG